MLKKQQQRAPDCGPAHLMGTVGQDVCVGLRAGAPSCFPTIWGEDLIMFLISMPFRPTLLQKTINMNYQKNKNFQRCPKASPGFY